MATIYDVAKRAGVSLATASRVLNGNPTVEESLRQRVIQAVAELKFVPNGSARTLVTKRTERVALIIPDITNPYYPEIARGAQDALDKKGYHLILSNTDDDPQRELRCLGMLEQVGIDGLIISPTTPVLDTGKRKRSRSLLVDMLERLGVPVVGVSPEPPTPHSDQVTVDEEGAAEKAVSHLLSLGHRRIALINGQPGHQVSVRRGAGYVRSLEGAGVPRAPELERVGDFRRSGGYREMMALLALEPVPTAVFAANDLMALGAMNAVHDAGLRIPEDVAFVGVDNIAEAVDSNPPLTSISVPRNYEYGRVAANLLLERLSGEVVGEPRLVRLETRLVVRESSAHRTLQTG